MTANNLLVALNGAKDNINAALEVLNNAAVDTEYEVTQRQADEMNSAVSAVTDPITS
jgi:hypothetical protein